MPNNGRKKPSVFLPSEFLDFSLGVATHGNFRHAQRDPNNLGPPSPFKVGQYSWFTHLQLEFLEYTNVIVTSTTRYIPVRRVPQDGKYTKVPTGNTIPMPYMAATI